MNAKVTWAKLSRVATNPVIQQSVIDFTTSMFPGAPAMSAAGTAGFAVGTITNPQELLR